MGDGKELQRGERVKKMLNRALRFLKMDISGPVNLWTLALPPVSGIGLLLLHGSLVGPVIHWL